MFTEDHITLAEQKAEAWAHVANAWRAVRTTEGFSGPRLIDARRYADLAERTAVFGHNLSAELFATKAYNAAHGITEDDDGA
jgi:hypothetical protein